MLAIVGRACSVVGNFRKIFDSVVGTVKNWRRYQRLDEGVTPLENVKINRPRSERCWYCEELAALSTGAERKQW